MRPSARPPRLIAILATAGALVSACGGDEPAPAASPGVTPAVTEAAPATDPAATAAAAPEATAPAGSAVSGGTAAATAAPATAAALVAPEALQFSAPLVGGGQIDLAAGYGGQPVLFWFWAPY